MSSISSEVKDLENICTAYGKIFFVIREELKNKGFECFDDFVFLDKIEYFKCLHINKVLSYCPFPKSCRRYETCTEKNCEANECDNGWAH